MHRRTALYVLGLALSASVVLAAGPAPTIDLDVVAVNQRSNCDVPEEYWLEVSNNSTVYHYKVDFSTEVIASAGVIGETPPDTRCINSHAGTFTLAPGACDSVTAPFYNDANQPCDDPCCFDENPDNSICNKCTTFRDLNASAVAWKVDGGQWVDIVPPVPLCGSPLSLSCTVLFNQNCNPRSSTPANACD